MHSGIGQHNSEERNRVHKPLSPEGSLCCTEHRTQEERRTHSQTHGRGYPLWSEPVHALSQPLQGTHTLTHAFHTENTGHTRTHMVEDILCGVRPGGRLQEGQQRHPERRGNLVGIGPRHERGGHLHGQQQKSYQCGWAGGSRLLVAARSSWRVWGTYLNILGWTRIPVAAVQVIGGAWCIYVYTWDGQEFRQLLLFTPWQ